MDGKSPSISATVELSTTSSGTPGVNLTKTVESTGNVNFGFDFQNLVQSGGSTAESGDLSLYCYGTNTSTISLDYATFFLNWIYDNKTRTSYSSTDLANYEIIMYPGCFINALPEPTTAETTGNTLWYYEGNLYGTTIRDDQKEYSAPSVINVIKALRSDPNPRTTGQIDTSMAITTGTNRLTNLTDVYGSGKIIGFNTPTFTITSSKHQMIISIKGPVVLQKKETI